MMNAHWREMKKYEAIQADVTKCASRAARESPYPDVPDMLAGLQKKHGKRRVAAFFANIVNGAPWDGRYTRESKEWAQKQPPIPQNPNSVNYPNLLEKPPGRFYTNMHPVLVDRFAANIIRQERDARAKRRVVSR